jgi:hypothetical protein
VDCEIHLDDLDTNTELGLIALNRNGKVYGKVGGGFTCLPLAVCGFYVTLHKSCEEIDQHFNQEYGGHSLNYSAQEMRKTADFLDATLAEYGLGKALRVDRDSNGNPAEPIEAFFGVEITERMSNWPEEIKPGLGFLTWKNND